MLPFDFDIFDPSFSTIPCVRRFLNGSSKSNKQNGIKYYWREDQNPETYSIFRIDADKSDKRSIDEICQHELKNAICITLLEKGPLKKEDLIKASIKTMGYSRSSSALIEAVERGIKYGRKTGEIIVTEDKMFELGA